MELLTVYWHRVAVLFAYRKHLAHHSCYLDNNPVLVGKLNSQVVGTFLWPAYCPLVQTDPQSTHYTYKQEGRVNEAEVRQLGNREPYILSDTRSNSFINVPANPKRRNSGATVTAEICPRHSLPIPSAFPITTKERTYKHNIHSGGKHSTSNFRNHIL